MLSYDQTKKLIDFALRETKWPRIEQFMVNDLKQPLANALPIYQDSIEGHSNLLNGKAPKDLEHLFSFMSKRKLAGSPLKQKLSPEGQKRLQVASLLDHVLAAEASAKPPKKWFDKMEKEIKEGNPDYSADQIKNTIGHIWYHQLSEAKKKEIRGREGKKYKAASMLERVLAESDDRKASPPDDVIYEVQPAKWKKAKPGQAQPLNLPMNPNAKNPEEEMTGLPKEYPAIARVLAGEDVTMPLPDFLKEHEHLLDVLDHPTEKGLKDEHDEQKKEAEKYGLKHKD